MFEKKDLNSICDMSHSYGFAFVGFCWAEPTLDIGGNKLFFLTLFL
jgi:hypothetical protein